MPDDFGYFGKGTTGYVQYMEAFNRNNSNNGGGKNPRGSGGCLTALALLALGFTAVFLVLI